MTYLSRLTLKRTPSTQALAALLNPDDESRRLDAHHRLIWTAFAGDAKARRDFLWRDEGNGRFLVLSARRPANAELFEEPDTKAFEPALRTGDQLSFLLRANATLTAKSDRIGADGKRAREHRDIVMAKLYPLTATDRASERMAVAQQAAQEWLAGVGDRHGFAVEEALARGYRVLEPRARGRAPRFGILDLEGLIRVNDPEAFLTRLLLGFGRAKAFGCGLMLIRRA